MKSIIFISLFFAIAWSQISITKVSDAIPNKVEQYDSLKNYLGNDYQQYKGQELYLIPKVETLRKYGYEGFFKDIKMKVIYKRILGGYNSKYEELAGKYFVVIDVLDASEMEGSDYFKDQYACLKLRMKKSEEVVYFKYDKNYEYLFDFLVVGYYEKQKQIFTNKDVLIRPFPKIEGVNQIRDIDIVTGEEIEFIKGEYVKCLDVTIDEKYFRTSLLLQNVRGNKFVFPLYARDLDIQRILTKDEAEQYKIMFGEDNWNTILKESVKVGFTKEMVTVSWGKPEDINKTIHDGFITEQWVYGSRNYVYFNNGIVTAIQ